MIRRLQLIDPHISICVDKINEIIEVLNMTKQLQYESIKLISHKSERGEACSREELRAIRDFTEAQRIERLKEHLYQEARNGRLFRIVNARIVRRRDPEEPIYERVTT